MLINFTKRFDFKLFFRNNSFIISLIVFTLIVKVFSTFLVAENRDPVHYWLSAKYLFSDLPYYFGHHRTTRFGIILPIAIIRFIFKNDIFAYYLPQYIMTAILVVYIFKIGKLLNTKLTGILSILLILFFPDNIRNGSDPFPFVFSSAYLSAAAYYYLLFLRNEKQKSHLILSSIFIFLSYAVKITNLFFLPVYGIFLFSTKKWFKNILLFAFPFVVLIIFESFFFYLNTGSFLGRIHSITGTHFNHYAHPVSLTKSYLLNSPINLVTRYLQLNLAWILSLILFFISSFYILFKNRKKEFIFIISLVFSFLLFFTFSIKSIDPLIPFIRIKSIYLDTVFPTISISLSLMITSILKNSNCVIRKYLKFNDNTNLKLITSKFAFIIILILFIPFQFFYFGHKYKTKYMFPLYYMIKQKNIINESYNNDIPFVIEIFDNTDLKIEDKFIIENIKKKISIKKLLIHINDSQLNEKSKSRLYNNYTDHLTSLLVFSYFYYNGTILKDHEGFDKNVPPIQLKVIGDKTFVYFKKTSEDNFNTKTKNILLYTKKPILIKKISI